MAEIDWALLSGSLDANQVARGVSAGFTPPNGGGSYVFGFVSKTSGLGVVGLHVSADSNPNFAPLVDSGDDPSGCSIRAAIKRGVSAAPTGFAPFIFACLQDTNVLDTGYILGLSDNDPHEIMLRKGSLMSGMNPEDALVNLTDPADQPRLSSETFLPNTWLHLRLDVIVNPNNDVVLRAYRSDLDEYPVTSPTWVEIPGLDMFIDDALGSNSGSNPLRGGYVGFGFYTAGPTRRGFVDHVQVYRQTV